MTPLSRSVATGLPAWRDRLHPALGVLLALLVYLAGYDMMTPPLG